GSPPGRCPSVGPHRPAARRCCFAHPRRSSQSTISCIHSPRRTAIGFHESKSRPVQGRNGERRQKAQISTRIVGRSDEARAWNPHVSTTTKVFGRTLKCVG